MKIIKYLLLILPIFSLAQIIHPNEIRKNIYDIILNEIKNNKPEYTFKLIQLDETINKFDNIQFTTLGIEFASPTYDNDKNFCQIFSNVECVEKFEIDKFSIKKVFVEHNDKDYQDYYGIYAPIDSWFGLISTVLNRAMKNESHNTVEVIVPIKNVYFKNGDEIIENFFYKFKLDKSFKVANFQKIKFSL